MTALTEQEAATKWCPLARVAGRTDATINRDQAGGPHMSCRCMASLCMAWRASASNEDMPRLHIAVRKGDLTSLETRSVERNHRRGVDAVWIHAVTHLPDGFANDPANSDYAIRPIPAGERKGFCGAFEPRVSEVQVAHV